MLNSLIDRVRNLTVSGFLRIGKNASIQVEGASGAYQAVSGAELRALSASNRYETVAAANTLTAAENGKTSFLALAAGFATTLPLPFAGAKYTFIVATAPTGGAYTIVTNDGADIMKGAVNEIGTATGPSDQNADVITFVSGVAVAGDSVTIESDGTSWFFRGTVAADGAITTATT